MTAPTYADYRRARAEGGAYPVPARYALAVARARRTDPMAALGLDELADYPDPGDAIAAGRRDGFDLRVVIDYDYLSLDDLGYGRFEEGTARPSPDAIPFSPSGYNAPRGTHWYIPSEPMAEVVGYFSRAGASRSVAREYARAMIERQAHDAEEASAYVVGVTASKMGTELARATLGGWEPGDEWQLSLAELLPDLIDEAITEARATLAELTHEEVPR
jgi:hypothetical protein